MRDVSLLRHSGLGTTAGAGGAGSVSGGAAGGHPAAGAVHRRRRAARAGRLWRRAAARLRDAAASAAASHARLGLHVDAARLVGLAGTVARPPDVDTGLGVAAAAHLRHHRTARHGRRLLVLGPVPQQGTLADGTRIGIDQIISLTG